VLLVALVLFRQNFLKPLCLLFCQALIGKLWALADEELLAATVTPESPHLLEPYGFLAAPLFYSYRSHVLILDYSASQSRCTKRDNLVLAVSRPIIIPKKQSAGAIQMAANQVVLYFDKQEDALLFTLAASSVMSAEGPVHSSNAAVKVAREISKASRITTEGVLDIT